MRTKEKRKNQSRMGHRGYPFLGGFITCTYDVVRIAKNTPFFDQDCRNCRTAVHRLLSGQWSMVVSTIGFSTCSNFSTQDEQSICLVVACFFLNIMPFFFRVKERRKKREKEKKEREKKKKTKREERYPVKKANSSFFLFLLPFLL